MAAEMAEINDVALITIGRNSGEAGDREAIPGDFYLTESEKQLINNVSEAFQSKGKKAIVILNIGGPVETVSWKEIPDAVLLAWQPGQEAGNSVVDILSGKVNPSGKLAVTFPVSYEDSPSSATFPGHAIKGAIDETPDLSGFSMMKRTPWEVSYDEDIFVGYRYFSTFRKPVSYEFRFGRSYTDFSLSGIRLTPDKFEEKISMSVEVTNTGEFSGREVVQVYLKTPGKKYVTPEMQLINFEKTSLLKPGETEKISFLIEARALTVFDESKAALIAETGEYEIRIGTSSGQIEEKKIFQLHKELIAEQVTPGAMKPKVAINKLRP